MPPYSAVVLWAVTLVRERVENLERVRARAAKKWNKGKPIHKLRTQTRRLRAALEDLGDCIPCFARLLLQCKDLGEKTTDARDAAVLIARLRRYQRFALPAERAEIRQLCAELSRQRSKGLSAAKHAVKSCRVEMPP